MKAAGSLASTMGHRLFSRDWWLQEPKAMRLVCRSRDGNEIEDDEGHDEEKEDSSILPLLFKLL